MGSVEIRRATAADAERLCDVARETFIATFGRLYPPEDLAQFLAEAHSADQYAAWAADAANGLWLAEQHGRAVGYALAGRCTLPHPEVTPDCGELKRLYVTPATQGGGTGGLLLRTALDWLHRPGRHIWLGVFSENHGAQRLYARHGFERAGDYIFHVGRVRDLEYILRRKD